MYCFLEHLEYIHDNLNVLEMKHSSDSSGSFSSQRCNHLFSADCAAASLLLPFSYH